MNTNTSQEHEAAEAIQLLRVCRAALDAILNRKPEWRAMRITTGVRQDTLGNLRAELGRYRLAVSVDATSELAP
jgi:hypothetical protein